MLILIYFRVKKGEMRIVVRAKNRESYISMHHRTSSHMGQPSTIDVTNLYGHIHARCLRVLVGMVSGGRGQITWRVILIPYIEKEIGINFGGIFCVVFWRAYACGK